jgi:hypothetical protein
MLIMQGIRFNRDSELQLILSQTKCKLVEKLKEEACGVDSL